MKIKTLVACVLLSASWSASQAFADQILRLDTDALVFCKDKAPLVIDSTSDVDYWASINTAMTSITVFKDSTLTKVAFTMTASVTPLANNAIGRKTVAINAILPPSALTGFGYISVNGKATYNKAGTAIAITKLNFVNFGLGLNPLKAVDLTCSASGNFIGKPAL